MDKPLARWTNKKRQETHNIKIRNETGDITINSTEIKRILWEYSEQQYTKKIG